MKNPIVLAKKNNICKAKNNIWKFEMKNHSSIVLDFLLDESS